MTRGRKPLPPEVHIQNGNPSRKTPEQLRTLPDKNKGIPACPKYIGPIAKKEWKRVTKALDKAKMISKIDACALELYCTQYEIHVRATKFIVGLGDRQPVYSTPNGAQQQVPQVGIINSTTKNLKSLVIEFGMTPSSRGRMIIPGDSKPDEMESLLTGGVGPTDLKKIKTKDKPKK